jgi:hypothetical protein
MPSNSSPTGIANSRRQRLTTRSGEVLERAYVFLTAEAWHDLRSLSTVHGISNSKVIAMLINNAKNGEQEDKNEPPCSRFK